MPSNDLVESHGLKPEDFDSIRDAVMETPRGRWFLTEYASRLRTSETGGLLDSMRRLEKAVTANHDALMSRLAHALENQAAPKASAPQADLAPKHMKYFKQDEEIFEPAPQAKIAAVPDAPRPEPKPEVPKGARVIIKRSTEASISIETEADAPAETPEFSLAVESMAPSPAPVTEAAPAQAADASPKRRITIIRHKPGEDIPVPLQDDIAKAS